MFRAFVSPEPIAPFALRLVRSTDVLAVVAEASKDLPVERLPTTTRSVMRANDELYEIVTDAGTIRARWVFDRQAILRYLEDQTLDQFVKETASKNLPLDT